MATWAGGTPPSPMPRHRVLIFTDRYPPYDQGGAERIAFLHASGLRERGYEVEIVSCMEPSAGAQPRTDTLPDGTRVHRIFPLHPFSEDDTPGFADKLLATALQLRHPAMGRKALDIVDAFRPDVLHAHHIQRFSIGAFCRLAPEIPRVLTFHIYGFECPRGGLYRTSRGRICEEKPLPCRIYTAGMRRELARADRIIAISRFIEQRLLDAGHARERLVYVPNGVPGLEDREALPLPPDKQVLFAGRIVHNKGLRQLLQAFAKIADPEAGLAVLGDGPERGELEAAFGGDPRVRFLGWMPPDEVAAQYRASRLVVVPSVCTR